MQLVNSMELGHSSSSHKDKSTKTHPHTHSRCDYDALCYMMAQSVLNWNEWLFFLLALSQWMEELYLYSE